MYYYTDVLMIPTASVTVILFTVRLWDGIIDPLIGHFMDNRTTKHGKYRGYLYYWAPISCIFFVMLFIHQNFSGYRLIFWCLLIYFLWSFSISVIEVANLPLLASVYDHEERNLANTMKIAASIIAALIASSATFKLIGLLGRGSEQRGFFITMTFFACVSLLAFMFGIRNIREKNIKEGNDLSLRGALSAIFKNKWLVYLYLMVISDQLCISIKSQAAVYHFKYHMHMPELVSLFFLLGIIGSLAVQPIIYWVSRRVRLSYMMVGGYLGSAACMAVTWLGSHNIWVLMISNMLFGVASAFPANLIYVYTAELSDNLSDEYGRSFGGIINSILQVSSRIGYMISGSVISLVLTVTSYVPNAAQTKISLLGILICFIPLTLLTSLLSAVFAFLSFAKAPSRHFGDLRRG
jgi:Na+/melibiose symporter-like transporter